MQSSTSDEGVQADLPEPPEETELKIRPLERVTRHPKVPPEPSAYGKYSNYSRNWILQDGRKVPGIGSEMRDKYKIPKKAPNLEGVRRRLLTDFFWEEMLDEVIDELAADQPVEEYCTEYEATYIKDNFKPRDLSVAQNKDVHLKYPLYGTGSSAVTFYSQVIKKTGPGEILEKFRKCQYFTKPMEERLDDGWVL